jgi:hypothetical protein
MAQVSRGHEPNCACADCREWRKEVARQVAEDYAEVGPCPCERAALRLGLIGRPAVRQALEDVEAQTWHRLFLWEMTGAWDDYRAAAEQYRLILRAWGRLGREFEARAGVHACDRAEEAAEQAAGAQGDEGEA